MTSVTSPAVDERPATELTAEIPAGRSLAWWGMVMFIASEATFVAVLLGSYFYLRFQYTGTWPQPPATVPGLARALVLSALILGTVVPMVAARRAERRDRPAAALGALTAAFVLGAGSLVVQAIEVGVSLRQFTAATNVYGSLYYLIHAVDALHVVLGVVLTGWLVVAALRGSFGPRHHDQIAITTMYWYFVAAVWIGVLFTLYLAPRI